MKHTAETLQRRYIAAIYLVAKLIDSNAAQDKVNAARAARDSALKEIRVLLPDYDRGYT